MDVISNSSKKKKIVGLIHHLEIGGAERMMLTVLNHLCTQNMEVHLIVFNYKGDLKDSLDMRLIVHDLGISSVSKGMPKCLKTIYDMKPDIVFSGIGHLNIALAPFLFVMKKILAKTKWIARETNIVSLQNQASKYPKVFDWLYKHTYVNYDVIISQSEDMKEDLERNYFKSEKIVVINNPIDVDKVTALANEELDFFYDSSKINLLTVARLRKEKRHDLMLEVLALLPEQYHLTIVGAGDEEAHLKKLCSDLKLDARVFFEGQQSNPYPYMKDADLFLLTSQREGFPNVLLEANSVGLPIVAFACQGGIKEIIKEGMNGFFVEYEDTKGMAKMIQQSIEKNFEKEKIISYIKAHYSHTIILQKYQSIIYN